MDRALGRSFGRAALDYERARPEWSDEPLAPLPVDAGAEVLDLGAGTGKFTRLLAGRYARVIAVEPDDDMRELIEIGEVLAGSAEAIPLWLSVSSVMALPPEERAGLAEELSGLLAGAYRLPLTNHLSWTRRFELRSRPVGSP